MRGAGVVVAAGRGLRLTAAGPKALVRIGGRALVAHAVARLTAAGLDHVVVVYTPGERPAFRTACEHESVAAFVPGGATRTASVSAGVADLPAGVDLVAVHDAARALCPVATIRAVLAAVGPDVVAAAPGLRVADTLKRVVDGQVVETVPREGLMAVQTPQVIRRGALEVALALREGAATDDLGLVEEAVARGEVAGRIVVVQGSVWARKVTFPSDIPIARALLAMEGESTR